MDWQITVNFLVVAEAAACLAPAVAAGSVALLLTASLLWLLWTPPAGTRSLISAASCRSLALPL
jgi:hypothetical protein